MKLAIISPPEDAPNEHQAVCRILRASPAIFHLRKPGRGIEALSDYLRQISSDLHHRIMVHGHRRLLDRYALKGIHFTEADRRRNPQHLRMLKHQWPRCHLSAAFHRIEDIREHDGFFDYIFLSPVFDSLSKPGHRAAFNHRDLRRFLAHTGHTVFALSGIDGQRVATAASLGFKGIAVLGAIWNADAPVAAARQLAAICRDIDRVQD